MEGKEVPEYLLFPEGYEEKEEEKEVITRPARRHAVDEEEELAEAQSTRQTLPDTQKPFEEEPYIASGKPIERHWSLDRTVNESLGIPEDQREMLGNRDLISIVNIAENLWTNFSEARHQQAAARTVVAGADPTRRGTRTETEQRYQYAQAITGVAVQMLVDGYKDAHGVQRLDPNELNMLLGWTVNQYGLEVAEGTAAATPNPEVRALQPQPSNGASGDAETGFAQTATRLGIPQERWGESGVFQQVGFLVGVENLRQRCEQAATSPETRPLHGPEVRQRYQSVGRLMGVVGSILEEGFQGRRADPASMQRNLNAALAPYNRQIIRFGAGPRPAAPARR